MNRKKILSNTVIIGGGLTGLLAAHMLSTLNIKTILIEKNNLDEISSKKSDGRALAITYYNTEIMKEYGLWELLNNNCNPIEQIRITDEYSPLFLHFDNKLVDNVPLGYMIEAQFLLSKLIKEVQNSKNVTILNESEVIKIDNQPEHITLETNNGDLIEAKLAIVADGKFSTLRDMAGIKVHSWGYGQTAIVCNVKHEINHENIAQEMFLPSGPFAILPLTGGNRSGVVWTEKSKLAPSYLKMDKKEFNYHLSKRFTDYLGKVEVEGEIFSYPLNVNFTNTYYKNRVCLVGDAAHTVHPIAGQGFNQGILDIKSLVDIMLDYNAVGLDVGSELVLKEYQKSRRNDNLAMLAFTDIMNRLFSNDIYPIKKARKIGLAAINKLPKLQRFFIKYAMGDR